LITLGIIGIVAALTMPSLVADYRKKVVITRLQKFYSIINQAANTKIANDGAIEISMLTAAYNPDLMLDFWDNNFKDSVKTLNVKKMQRGILAALPDGSGVYLTDGVAIATLDNAGHYMRWVFCPVYKDCGDIDETAHYNELMRKAKSNSMFMLQGFSPSFLHSGLTREQLKANCGNAVHSACGRLIMHDNWEIKYDYPW
jgi:type II secretory pathway pseudopilin PulG